VQEFASSQLNRDTWSKPELKELIANSFLMIQTSKDSEEGKRYSLLYKVGRNKLLLLDHVLAFVSAPAHPRFSSRGLCRTLARTRIPLTSAFGAISWLSTPILVYWIHARGSCCTRGVDMWTLPPSLTDLGHLFPPTPSMTSPPPLFLVTRSQAVELASRCTPLPLQRGVCVRACARKVTSS
jgi:hypothetical protein